MNNSINSKKKINALKSIGQSQGGGDDSIQLQSASSKDCVENLKQYYKSMSPEQQEIENWVGEKKEFK